MSIYLHVCISGFRQRQGHWNGALTIRESLICNGHSLGIQSRVEYYTWDTPWCDVAEYAAALQRKYREDDNLVVLVYAYSWGAGWGAMRLAKKLGARGINIRVMVLCEPIYRHPNPLMRWRAMSTVDLPFLPQPTIRAPDNVDEIWWFVQRQNRPSGHRILAQSSETVIHEPVELHAEHQHMHQQKEWHDKCLEVANEIVNFGGLAKSTAVVVPRDQVLPP